MKCLEICESDFTTVPPLLNSGIFSLSKSPHITPSKAAPSFGVFSAGTKAKLSIYLSAPSFIPGSYINQFSMATKIALDMVKKDKTRVVPEDEERRPSFNLGEGLGLSNGETRKKFDNILALTEAEELNDDYVNVYSTCALVGALVMSFLAPAASARIEAKPDNIWGEALTPYGTTPLTFL